MQGGWRTLLWRGPMLAAIVAVAVINGRPSSPLFDSVSYVLFLFSRGSALVGPDLLFHLTSALLSALTLMVAGIPAALWERLRGSPVSTPVSLALWLLTSMLLALPALRLLLETD